MTGSGRSSPPVRSTFGHWRRPASPGLGHLGVGGTAVLFAGLIAAVLASLADVVAAVTVAAATVVLLLPLAYRRDGRSGVQRIVARAAWWRGRRRRQHLFRSGVTGLVPGGSHTLPGLAASSTLYAAQDAYGRPFALLHVRSTGHYSVVLRCDADGAALVDQEQVETWVAAWGDWLSALAHEPGFAAAAVTVETAPDPGTRLSAEVDRQVSPDAPQFARAVLEEIVRSYPAGSAVIATRVQLTYRAAPGAGARRDPAEMATELGTRLPGLVSALLNTGAGAAAAMTCAEVAAAVRVAYDPAAAAYIDDARQPSGRLHDHAGRGGEEFGWDELGWAEVGPTAAQESWASYRHDSGVSVTWSMSEAPRGAVLSGVLSRLVAPHPDLLRKRVTLLYRPHDPATAARLVESDLRTARFLASRRANVAARDDLDVRAAMQSAGEEAAGAGVVRFALLVTATVGAEDQLRQAEAVVDGLAASARLRLRRVYGSQAAAFTAGLPVGVVLPLHVRVPAALSDAMR